MADGVSVDVGSMYPYLEHRVLSLFGKDAATVEWKQTIQRLVRTSLQESSYIQCVGMASPIPIAEIYQPTNLIRPITGESRLPSLVPQICPTTSTANLPGQLLIGELGLGKSQVMLPDLGLIGRLDDCHSALEEEVPFSAFLEEGSDTVIVAGPGWGKTTLLHWMHQKLIESESFVPLLFTLRRPEVYEELEEFVRQLEKGRTIKSRSVVLLVDGYDEVDIEKRQRVSGVLMRFRSLQVGRFFLTCRSFYDVYDLAAIRCRLSPFREANALQFIQSFSKAYGAHIDESELVAELHEHGLGEFSAHPLMLALVCILKTGPNPSIPRRAIGLIRRAIDTLTFRWDEAKYIKRGSEIPLDGEERVRCLMRIAYDMKSLQASWAVVEKSISAHLELLQLKGIDKRVLMREITQWYGLVVPLDDENWQFVHRTIHDFLAARFWVESGAFRGVEKHRWDTRAAYAACLVPDATVYIIDMLKATGGYPAFTECLYNSASFKMLTVAEAIIDRVARAGCELADDQDSITVRIAEDFFGLASDELLRVLVDAGSNRNGQREVSAERNRKAGAAVACYALAELALRSLKVSRAALHGILGIYYSGDPNRSIAVWRRRRLSDTDGTLTDFVLSEAVE